MFNLSDASQDYADTLPSENLPTDAESLDDNEGYSAGNTILSQTLLV